jgi:FAD/FMN-containing dehydrogenase
LLVRALLPYLPLTAARRSGSLSAEHGVGVMKAPYISYAQNDVSIDLMKRIKKMFDPKGILNPGKVSDNDVQELTTTSLCYRL